MGSKIWVYLSQTNKLWYGVLSFPVGCTEYFFLPRIIYMEYTHKYIPHCEVNRRFVVSLSVHNNYYQCVKSLTFLLEVIRSVLFGCVLNVTNYYLRNKRVDNWRNASKQYFNIHILFKLIIFLWSFTYMSCDT